MNQDQVKKIVEDVIHQVRTKGDAAVIGYMRKFDKVSLTPKTLKVPSGELQKAFSRIDVSLRKSLLECAKRIERFHLEEKKQLPKSWSFNNGGVRLGQMFSPVDRVGLYVPGGRFAYPSTVLMTGIPARIAGVKKIVMVTPPARLSDEILAAAYIAGVTEVYRVGGPSSLAALALGTKSIPKVDLIVGPGNALVTEAKRQLFGEVGIDLLAGPSELVVIADRSVPASFIAADLAAQAEHDPDSIGVLIATEKNIVSSVKKLLPSQLVKQCQFFVQPNLLKAAQLANQFAGEHVEVLVKNPRSLMKDLKHGGTFFLNKWSPAVMGDYWAGPSHVLPTARSARFGSGLSLMTFIKRSSLVEVSEAAYKKGFLSAQKIAQVEGLVQHASALSVRMEGRK